MFGAVVVGVGIAGRVRMRDLLSPHPSSAAEIFNLKGFVSRRTLDEQQGVKQLSLDEALSCSDVQVAFVCTENASHEDHIRRFLAEGKHVCVEYPMTLNYAPAVELWEFARQKGVILHEEHIELFTPDFKQLKKDVAGKKLQEGSLHFTGGPLKPDFGFPSFSGIARLTWLVDLFGELTVKAATMEEDEGRRHMKMTAHFLTQDQKPLTWIEERGEGMTRAKHINLHFNSCTITELPAGQREEMGLFMQDLVRFGQKLRGDVTPDDLQAEQRRVLHCLRLAQEIQQFCQGNQS